MDVHRPIYDRFPVLKCKVNTFQTHSKLSVDKSSRMRKFIVKTEIELMITRIYGGPQLSHQIQILTSKTNSPHQNQIYHVKHKFAIAKAKSSQQKQIRHIKNKFVTAKTNSSHQKQISHIKIKNRD